MSNASYFFDPNEKPDATIDAASQLPEEKLPSVAVVTRTKDRPILFKRALRSVADQTYPNIQWVVVNDGGNPDHVIDIIENGGVDQTRVTLVSNEESVGMEAASNLGVRAVETDYVAIHDDDDTWHPKYLEETLGFLRSPRGLKYKGAISKVVYVSEEIDGDDVIRHDEYMYNDWVEDVTFMNMLFENIFPPIAFVYEREVYNTVGGYDETLPVLGDWDFHLRFLHQADIGVVPQPLAYYHHRDRAVAAAGNYANSVSGGVTKHQEYNALLRNRYFRQSMGKFEDIGSAVILVHTIIQSRNFLRDHRAPSRTGGSGAIRTMDPTAIDALKQDPDWVAHNVPIRVMLQGFIRKITKNLSG